MNEPFILHTDASQFAIGAVLAQVQNGLERVICYASRSLNRAQSRYSTSKRELLAIVNYTRHFRHYLLGRQFKIDMDHRWLQWLPDCMSRLPASTTALHMIATMDIDASVVGQPNHSSQSLPSFSSHTPPAQPSHSTTIPRDTVKSNQSDDEQSGVKHGHETGTHNNGQTDDEQSEVRNGNEAVESTNG